MKRILTVALSAAMLFASASSYAVVCTYKGPYGAIWQRNAAGLNKVKVAQTRAYLACEKGKRGDKPCVFMGCIYDETKEVGFRNYRK